MSALEQFIKRVKVATSSKSKDIRLSISEAQTICTDLSSLLLSENQSLSEIINLKDQIEKLKDRITHPQEIDNNNEITMDGGKF